MFFQAVSVTCEFGVDIRTEFGACGTCETVFAMMDAQSWNFTVQGYAMGPLRYLSEGNTANSVLMYRLGAFEAIVRVANDLRINYLGRASAKNALQQIVRCLTDADTVDQDELQTVLRRVLARMPSTISP